jgi:hypothetical protein
VSVGVDLGTSPGVSVGVAVGVGVPCSALHAIENSMTISKTASFARAFWRIVILNSFLG